ncbi:MAG TPA: 30S ribosomal protein S18 [Kofleriaceae bacterium]|nr:30S ribosomal protein S18 [Kofleriaceae bacterium]
MATEQNQTDDSKDDDLERPVIRMLGKSRGRSTSRRKMCRFCADDAVVLDYKNPSLLKNFITERGKLIPRRISGNCAKHQRKLSVAVRRARMIALVPFTVTGR